MVQADTDVFAGLATGAPAPQSLPPQVTVTWYRTGAPGQDLPVRPVAEVWEAGAAAARGEGLRALRGKVLRTATYALDGTAQSRYPYSVVDSSYRIRVLDPAPADPDGYRVSVALPSETLAAEVERCAVPAALQYPDRAYLASLAPPVAGTDEPPRRQHTVAVIVNDWGQVERSLSAAYGRADVAARPAQRTTLVTVGESAFANLVTADRHYRLGAPLVERRYELRSPPPAPPGGCYDLATAASLVSSPVVPDDGTTPATPARRKLAVVRTRYWNNAVTAELPDGVAGFMLGAPGARRGAHRAAGVIPCARAQRGDPHYRGAVPRRTRQRRRGAALGSRLGGAARPGPVPPAGGVRRRVRPRHLRRVRRRRGARHLQPGHRGPPGTGNPRPVPAGPAAPTWNTATAEYDYRLLAVRRATDPHGVVAEGEHSALGVLVRRRRRGPAGEGTPAGEWDEEVTHHLAAVPQWIESRTREEYAPGTRWQHSVSYSDGAGRPLLSKVQVEPGPVASYGPDGKLVPGPDGTPLLTESPVRWLGNGRTVYDGKGRPVARYDPYFAPDSRFEDAAVLATTGHAVRLRYDPAGRIARTDYPDGSFDRFERQPWSVTLADRADTVIGSAWYQRNSDPGASAQQQQAAAASAAHADTPALTRVDARGRVVEMAERIGPRELASTVGYNAVDPHPDRHRPSRRSAAERGVRPARQRAGAGRPGRRGTARRLRRAGTPDPCLERLYGLEHGRRGFRRPGPHRP